MEEGKGTRREGGSRGPDVIEIILCEEKKKRSKKHQGLTVTLHHGYITRSIGLSISTLFLLDSRTHAKFSC